MKTVEILAHGTRVWKAKVKVPYNWGRKEIEYHYLNPKGHGDPYDFEEDYSDPLNERWEIKQIKENEERENA